MNDDARRSFDQIEKVLVDIAVEGWSFVRPFHRMIAKLDAGKSNRCVNQLRCFQKNRLKKQGTRMLRKAASPPPCRIRF